MLCLRITYKYGCYTWKLLRVTYFIRNLKNKFVCPCAGEQVLHVVIVGVGPLRGELGPKSLQGLPQRICPPTTIEWNLRRRMIDHGAPDENTTICILPGVRRVDGRPHKRTTAALPGRST